MTRPIKQGSGIESGKKLSLPVIKGDGNGYVTVDEMMQYSRDLQRWADRLHNARIGWSVQGVNALISIASGFTAQPTFSDVVEDSSAFTKYNLSNPPTVFQVPAGYGGQYVVTWTTQLSSPVATTVSTNASFGGVSNNYTIPASVFTIDVLVDGGSGNPAGGTLVDIGGKGGRVTGTIAVTPGQVYTCMAGGNTQVAPGVAQGTPGGGLCHTVAGNSGQNGGGYSYIKHNGDPDSAALVISGGGGGGGNQNTGLDHCSGGDGGGLIGGNGVVLDPRLPPGTGFDPFSNGLGGTQIAGGTGGLAGTFGINAPSGSALQGANASTGNSSAGGGGGWFGGGASHIALNQSGQLGSSGAGGGSSFTTGVTNVIHTQGGATFGTSKVQITTYTNIGISDATVQIYCRRRQVLNGAPYATTELISQGSGISPIHGAINCTLNDGDRVFMQITNNSGGTIAYNGLGTRLAAFRTGT